MSSEPSDSRRAPRGAIELKVEYKRLNSFFADYTKNISKDGTFIRTDKPLDIGTDFLFKLFIPGQQDPIQLCGQVKWTISAAQGEKVGREPGMGIEFIYQDDEERRRLRALVERLMVDSLGENVYRELMERSVHRGPLADGPVGDDDG